jgi:uncharacterized protein
MSEEADRWYTAFVGGRRIGSGPIAEIAGAAWAAVEEGGREGVMAFDDESGALLELDLRGSAADVARRYSEAPSAPDRRRGRPKLGVVGKEVTLLPRHWAWLGAQRGSASATLRRLVDAARRDAAVADRVRQAQDAAYRFMSATLGDQPGFEEATRALFAGDAERFNSESRGWPADVREYALRLAGHAFS